MVFEKMDIVFVFFIILFILNLILLNLVVYNIEVVIFDDLNFKCYFLKLN